MSRALSPDQSSLTGSAPSCARAAVLPARGAERANGQSSISSALSASSRSAAGSRRSPSGVSTMRCELRFISLAPRDCSSRFTCTETQAVETLRDSAARVKLPCRHTATKIVKDRRSNSGTTGITCSRPKAELVPVSCFQRPHLHPFDMVHAHLSPGSGFSKEA